MPALIIIGIILGVLALILLIPVGVDLGYEEGQFHLAAKANGFTIQLVPKGEKPPEHEKKPKKKKEPKPKKDETEGEEKPKKKLALDLELEEILALVKTVLRGLGRFGRKIRVQRFLLHYLAAGHDPYDTAVSFGRVNAALYSLAPLCRRRFAVKDCDVWTDVDFMAERMELDVGVALTIRIGQILGVALSLAFGAGRILLRSKLRSRRERKALQAAERLEQKETENIQEEERMASNG